MPDLILYWRPFLSGFFLSIFFIFSILFWSKRVNLKNSSLRRGERHLHSVKVSRWGGVAVFLAFLLTVLFDPNLVITRDIGAILAGGSLIFFLGVWDDVWELKWTKQLFFQILAVVIFFIFGATAFNFLNFGTEFLYWREGIQILGIFLGIVWILILINAMNWLDGIDGISGGISLIACLTIFLLSLKPEVNQPPVGILSIALGASILGFLIFNFPPAKIMLGSGGVFLIGFVLAGLSVFAGAKVATALLILFIPILDFFGVIFKRWRKGKSIFDPDREHLHHKLLEIGWSQRKINWFFYAVTAGVALAALHTRDFQKVIILSLLAGGMTVFYFFVNQKRELTGDKKIKN
ncbi:MAG: MraY family glycosyltransferase [Candidatus Moraniibacteriota bacterium]